MNLLSPVLEKVQPVSIRLQVVCLLREAILSGRFKPGERLLERKLAEEMGVSQAAVREALPELEYEGLITRKPNTATYVTELHPEKVKEMVQVRLQLEPFAMVLAGQKMNQENIQELTSLISEIELAVAANDLYGILHTDFRFHQKIWQIAGNETLAKMLKHLCAPLIAFFLMVNPDQRLFKGQVKVHQRLLDSLKTGNAKEVRKAAREHVLSGWYPPEYKHVSMTNFKNSS